MSPFMSPMVSSIGWALLHSLWQGLLIGCVCAAALALLRNARAELRYRLACAALLMCIGWPLAGLFARLAGGDGAMLGTLRVDAFIAAIPVRASRSWLLQMQWHLPWIVSAWAACAAALALRLAFGLVGVCQLGRDRKHGSDAHWQARLDRLAAQCGITRPVRLRIVERLDSPITAGWWRPIVLVPAALISGMPAHLLEALLAHELAHIRHLDYLSNLLQNVIEVLMFYHPAVWWISRQIRIEREHIADDFAARELGEPRRLALALSELERFQFSHHQLAQAANGGVLMSRITRLLRPRAQTLNWKAALPILTLAAACVTVYAHANGAEKQTQFDSANHRAQIDFKTCAKPVWPDGAIAAKHEGKVALSFLVDESGSVQEAKVIKSSGHEALDLAARDGIKLCHFKPAVKDNKATTDWVEIQYVWTLN
ncbi:MAG: M56 family metallopeptidase [Pseudomonadota bacterium]